MKKFSLFSLLGLLAFVAMPIYAQDVYFDENYIVVPEDAAVEAVDEEAVVDEEINNEVEEEIVNDIDNAVLAVEEEPVFDRDTDEELIPELDFSDFDGFSNVALSSSSNASPLARILAWWLWLFWVILIYLIFAYFALLPISAWEIYRRAGKKGWAFLVPFWGSMVYSEIAGMSKWLWLLPWLVTIWGFFQGIVWSGVYWIVLNVLSIISLIWLIVANYRVARRYGWNIFLSILHAILIFTPITFLVLGLGNYKYQAKSETVVEA